MVLNCCLTWSSELRSSGSTDDKLNDLWCISLSVSLQSVVYRVDVAGWVWMCSVSAGVALWDLFLWSVCLLCVLHTSDSWDQSHYTPRFERWGREGLFHSNRLNKRPSLEGEWVCVLTDLYTGFDLLFMFVVMKYDWISHFQRTWKIVVSKHEFS